MLEPMPRSGRSSPAFLKAALIVCALSLVVVLIAAGVDGAALAFLFSCLAVLADLPFQRREAAVLARPPLHGSSSPRAPPCA